jgi:hypothetical protein
MNCRTKGELSMEWWKAAEIYARAALELSDRVDSISRLEYQRLKTAAESARRSAIEAQADLKAHVADHGCGGSGELAA